MLLTKAWATAAAVLVCISGSVLAQVNRPGQNGQNAIGSAGDADQSWIGLDAFPAEVQNGEPWIRAKTYGAFAMNRAAIEKLLAQAPMEGPGVVGIPVSIPMPDGSLALFRVVESPVMEAELQAKFPQIRTYAAVGIDDPFAHGRLDLTPAGFHAMIFAPSDSRSGGQIMVDPFTRGDDVFYSSYYTKDYGPEGWKPFMCHTIDQVNNAVDRFGRALPPGASAARIGNIRREYRLAVSATGEFTAFHGGTVAGGLAAVTTMVNRITGVYESDLAVRLKLVANNNLIIYTNAATDPFTNASSASASNSANQTSLDATIGSANYDVGHVVHQGSDNGLAGAIGNVCINGSKGQGYTSVSAPTGDLLAIDYCAHELGHQFGGRHTFNNCGGSGPGDSAARAVEPGSGVTIMAYAGICSTTNIAANSIAMFSGINIFGNVAQTDPQMLTYISTGSGGSCDVEVPTGNNAPVVNAGPDYIIPRQTAFQLTASGIDPDNDPIVYSWEQMDGGSSQSIPVSDNGTNPLFRPFLPVSSPSRTFPRLEDIINNTTLNSECYPNTNRALNFRCVVRDTRLNGSGVNYDDMLVTVTTASGPFVVTAPNGGGTLQGSTTVTWNVAGTTAAPVNCANVAILLSTDGGLTYPYTLVSSTPNDGSETVALPNVSSSTCRIRVQAVGNIFFDISNANFTVQPQPAGVFLAGAGTPSAADSTGNGNNNGRIDPGETDIRLTVSATNFGLTTATGVTGTLTSLTPTVSVVQAVRSYPNLATNAVAANASPYVISVSASHPCGDPINLRLALNSDQGGGNNFDFTLSSGIPGGTGAAQTYNYAGAPLAIPDNNTTGVSATVSVSSSITSIADLDLRIGGTSCSGAIGSTSVGLDHTFVGDLIIDLIGPDNTTVRLMNRRGSFANNLCQLTFDDAAASSITSITSANEPVTGSFRPEQVLSAFNGKNANGVWTLKVVDAASIDTGSVRAFSLIFRGNNPPVCDPPATNPCPADFTGDGFVDDSDFVVFAAAYDAFTVPPANPDCDLTGDGFVDDSDFVDFAVAYDAFTCP